MARKRLGLANGAPVDRPVPDADSVDISGLDGAGDDLDRFDPFAGLFDRYDGVNTVVDVIRMAPAEFRGVKVKGFVGNLEPLSDRRYYAWMAERFGGGTYRLIVRDSGSGVILASQSVDFPGDPIVHNVATSAAPVGAGAGSRVPMTVAVEGAEVDLNAPMIEVVKMLTMLRGIKEFFKEDNPVQAQGLSVKDLVDLMAVTRQGDALDNLKRIREALPEVFARDTDSGGTDLLGVVKEAITQTGNVLSGIGRGSARVPVGRASVAASAPVPVLPRPVVTEPGAESAPEKEEGFNSMGQAVNPKEMALGLVRHIAACFGQVPRPAPVDVAAQLDLLVDVDMEVRRKVEPFKGALGGVALAWLPELVPEDVEYTAGEWREYFGEVFAHWTGTAPVAAGGN